MFCPDKWLFTLTDVPCIFSLYNKVYPLEYSESLTGSLFMTSNNGPYMSLQNYLTKVFLNWQLNKDCCLLMVGINTVAVIKNSEQSFKIFYAHSRFYQEGQEVWIAPKANPLPSVLTVPEPVLAKNFPTNLSQHADEPLSPAMTPSEGKPDNIMICLSLFKTKARLWSTLP